MAIFDLFSKKQKRLRGEMPDVYQYDTVPEALRVQIVHIWSETLGNHDESWHNMPQEAYKYMVETLCKEYGLFQLSDRNLHNRKRDYSTEFVDAFLTEKDNDRCIDFIQISFMLIDQYTRTYNYLRKNNASELADDAISELNARFKEHGVGYHFINGEIIRIDSEFIHAQVVKPALNLLNQKIFSGAREEFLRAHEHYRHGNNKEALNECLKSFESVMKAICKKRQWSVSSDSTSKTLIQICFEKELIPLFWQQQFTSLRSLLESSIPTGRNKLSGHGQGTDPVVVPDYLTAYILHMTAATIVFLTEAEKNLK